MIARPDPSHQAMRKKQLGKPGVAIPKGVPYWFDNKEKEPMELYHITSRDTSVKDVHRVNFAAYTEAQKARGPRPGGEATEEEKGAAAKL